MHVFLTGPVQIGKSTLIAAALDALQPERLGGFRTVSAKPEADGSRPVYLHPAAAQDLRRTEPRWHPPPGTWHRVVPGRV